MQAILWPIVSWLLREVIVKFVVVAAVIAAVSFLAPVAVGLLSSFISVSGLSSAFAGIGPGLWYFILLFRLDFGLPLVISAFISRFLIRRLPVIG